MSSIADTNAKIRYKFTRSHPPKQENTISRSRLCERIWSTYMRQYTYNCDSLLKQIVIYLYNILWIETWCYEDSLSSSRTQRRWRQCQRVLFSWISWDKCSHSWIFPPCHTFHVALSPYCRKSRHCCQTQNHRKLLRHLNFQTRNALLVGKTLERIEFWYNWPFI